MVGAEIDAPHALLASGRGLFEPKIVDRHVVAVEFDETGVVKEVRQYDEQDGRRIDPVERVTPTAGNEMTILDQFFGNLGRFNK